MWFALFSIIFYILSLLLIAPFLMNSSEGKLSQSKIPFFLTALAAIVLHAVSTFPLLEFGMNEFEAENNKNDRYAVPVVFTNTC